MKALLLENISAVAVEGFRQAGYEIEAHKTALDERELAEKIKPVSLLGVRSKTRVTAAVLEAAPKLGERDFGGVHPLSGLLKIALSGAATAESRVHVRQNAPMRRDIFLGKGDQARIAHDVDIGF